MKNGDGEAETHSVVEYAQDNGSDDSRDELDSACGRHGGVLFDQRVCASRRRELQGCCNGA